MKGFASFAAFAVWLGGVADVQALPVFNPDNGHYYDSIRLGNNNTTWAEALAAAAAMTHNGWQGHLATVTSQAENDFILANLGGFDGTRQKWLGGFQDRTAPDYSEPAGGWRWITGETWSYTSWAGSEPNEFTGREDFLIYEHAAGKWNDLGPFAMRDGFIVEFEPAPEPASVALMGLGGLGVLGEWLRGRRRRISALA